MLISYPNEKDEFVRLLNTHTQNYWLQVRDRNSQQWVPLPMPDLDHPALNDQRTHTMTKPHTRDLFAACPHDCCSIHRIKPIAHQFSPRTQLEG